MAAKTARPSPRSERNRQRIIEAATHLFNERGYHGVSLDEVAEVLGATKQVVYYQFADKADLLAWISRRGVELTLAALVEAETTNAPVVERLSRFCAEQARIVIEAAPAISVYIREEKNLREDDRRRILGLRAEVDRRVTMLIDEGNSRGEFAVENSPVAARAITGMISYMCFWARQTNHTNDAALSRQMARLALQTLGCSGAQTIDLVAAR